MPHWWQRSASTPPQPSTPQGTPQRNMPPTQNPYGNSPNQQGQPQGANHQQGPPAQGPPQGNVPPPGGQGVQGRGGGPRYTPPQIGNRFPQTPAQRRRAALRAMPEGADPDVWHIFLDMDRDGNGVITLREMENGYRNNDYSRFDRTTLQMLMDLFDEDHNGKIDFNEFSELTAYIDGWVELFERFDRNPSDGRIDRTELISCLRDKNYNISESLADGIIRKFGEYRNHQELYVACFVPACCKITNWSYPALKGHTLPTAEPESITLDHFIRACVLVEFACDLFREELQKQQRQGRDTIELSQDDILEMVMNVP